MNKKDWENTDLKCPQTIFVDNLSITIPIIELCLVIMLSLMNTKYN